MTTKHQRHRAAAELCEVVTSDFDTAAQCFYCYLDPDGQTIQGRTVRFAELVAAFWGGIVSESQPVAIGPRVVRVRTTCREVERDVSACVEIETPVEHGETSKALQLAGAVGYRVSLFRVVPSLLFEKPFQAAIHFATGGGRGKRRAAWVLRQLIRKYPHLDQAQCLQIAAKPSVEALTVADLALLVGRSNFITAAKESSISSEEFGPSQP